MNCLKINETVIVWLREKFSFKKCLISQLKKEINSCKFESLKISSIWLRRVKQRSKWVWVETEINSRSEEIITKIDLLCLIYESDFDTFS